jgi:NAD(P)H dehydrogenase (quinone)
MARGRERIFTVGKLLVTGASGDIGRKTLLHLLKRVPANQLVGLVRDPAKAEDLAALGVELRRADYLDPASLSGAFVGVEKLMLTSTHAFTDRKTAHANVIDAAIDRGVHHVVYMPIFRKKNSGVQMKEITEEDIFTEEKLTASGLTYTFAYHPPFLDVLGFYIGPKAQELGVRVPAGNGKFAAATRDDLAAAHAAILAGEGHEKKRYSLTGDPAVSFSDIADILSKIQGTKVPHVAISDAEYLKSISKGVPDFIAQFVLEWVRNMNAGEWDEQTKDLESLIGHKPKSPAEFFRDGYRTQ